MTNAYELNKNVTVKLLKDYGYKYDRNTNDYIYRASGYYIETAGRKIDTVIIKFTVNIDDNLFKFDVICNDGSTYYPFYNNDVNNNTVANIIQKNINKNLERMIKAEIIEKFTPKCSTLFTKINIKKLNKDAVIPTRGSDFAAGYDLYAYIENSVTIQPHTTVKIGTGLAFELPENTFGAIYARSGLATKRGLRPSNCTGVCDQDYRGEYIVALHNDTDFEQTILPKERIAQLILMPYIPMEFNEVSELSDTARGDGGFGSTGK